MASSEYDKPSILGIVVGLLIVVALAYFLIGDRIGIRDHSNELSGPVDPPNVPAAPPPAPQ